MVDIKTIRLNKEEYDRVVKARNLLLHRGIDSLSPENQRVMKFGSVLEMRPEILMQLKTIFIKD